MGGVWTGNDVYFAQTQSQYTAAFLPEYPKKSKRDALLSNGVDAVETVRAIKTIEDCLWKQYPQY